MNNKMAIIGVGDSISVFSAVGIDAYPVKDGLEAGEKIKALAKDYNVIFITDTLAVKNKDLIDKYISNPYPAIISLPSENGSNGYGMSIMKEAMEKALGIDIFSK